MLSNKRTRIFVSFLTLMTFLSVLVVGLQSLGVQAQGPEADANEAASEVRGLENGPNPDSVLYVYKSVQTSTVIQTGDRIVYEVNVSNTTAATVSNVAFTDSIPYNTRYNYTTTSSTDYTYDSSEDAILNTNRSAGISITAGASTAITYEVESNDEACGIPITNKAIATVGTKTYYVEREAIAFDQVYTSFSMEAAGGASNTDAGIYQTNFFTSVSSDGGVPGWNHGVPVTPTFLGAPGGVQVWGTNLTGPYTDTNSNYVTQIMTGTLDLTGISATGTPLYLVWQQYLDFLSGFNRARVFVGENVASPRPLATTPVYDTGSANSGVIDTQGWDIQQVDIQAYAGKKILVVFQFSTQGDNVNLDTSNTDPHWGWYVDDIGVGACNVVGLTLNKVASTSQGSCTDSTVSGISSKKEAKAGHSGLLVPTGTDVYYCFAVKNTGNVTLTNHILEDTLLRNGYIITGSTATNFSGSPLNYLQSTGLAPGKVTNTNYLLGNTNITPTLYITQSTVNTATWYADVLGGTFYNVVSSTNLSDKGFSSIVTGTALELKDDSEITITLPFAFTLFTKTHPVNTKIVVGNNGGILFGNTLSDVLASNTALPLTHTQGVSVAQGTQAIFPFWDDLGTGQVYSDVQGTSPNRKFIIEWLVPHKTVGGTDTAQFQAIMYETSNDVVFVYNDASFGNSTYNNGASATIGLSNLVSETRQFSFNSAKLSDGMEIRFGHSAQATDSETVGIQDGIIAITATASTDGTCGASSSDNLKVTVGTQVTYCYVVENTGSVTFTHHGLTDTMFGDILTSTAVTLAPGARYTVTKTATPTETAKVTVGWDSLASNKYPFRTSKDSTSPTTYDFYDVGFGATNQGTKLSMDTSDNGEGDVTMPFTFMFYGKESNQLRVGNNGGILFGFSSAGDVSPNNEKLPAGDVDANNDHPFGIFPYWDTFEGEQGGVYYNTLGSAPNRMFVVQWDAIQHYEQSSSQGTFQVVLYEGSNQIKFQYQDLDFGSSAAGAANESENYNFGASATVGLNHSTTDAHEYSYNNERQGGALTGTLNVTDSMSILWYPMNASSSDMLTVTVNYTPSIQLTKTVGTQSGVCATTDEITVTAGTTVYYCYAVENTGNTTFDSNTLQDDKLGLTILFDSSQLSLGPGEKTDTVALGTSSLQAVITTDTMNTATWTATSNPTAHGTAVATDTAKVNIELPPTAVEIGDLGVSRSSGLPLGSLVVGMLLLVAGGYVVHRRRMQ